MRPTYQNRWSVVLAVGAALVVWPALASAQPAAVVTNPTPRWQPSSAWRVASEPRFVIGLQDGPAHLLFDRLVGVFVVGDSVVVADGGSKSVRVLTRQGRLVRTHGRPGDGPGEFRDITRFWLDSENSPVVYDGGTQRLTIFRPGQTLTVPFRGATAFVTPYGRLRNGTFITGTPQQSVLSGNHGDLLVDSITLWIGVDEHRALERLPNRSRVVFRTSEWTRYPFVPLMIGPSVAVADTHFVVGHGTVPELRYYNSSGVLFRIVRWAESRERVTREIRSELSRAMVAAQREPDRPAWERFVREVAWPELLPVFDRVILDRLGVTWLRTYRHRSGVPEEWTVIDQSGSWLGSLTLPARFEATEFGPEYVAGVLSDALGVQRAAAYTLSRR